MSLLKKNCKAEITQRSGRSSIREVGYKENGRLEDSQRSSTRRLKRSERKKNDSFKRENFNMEQKEALQKGDKEQILKCYTSNKSILCFCEKLSDFTGTTVPILSC